MFKPCSSLMPVGSTYYLLSAHPSSRDIEGSYPWVRGAPIEELSWKLSSEFRIKVSIMQLLVREWQKFGPFRQQMLDKRRRRRRTVSKEAILLFFFSVLSFISSSSEI